MFKVILLGAAPSCQPLGVRLKKVVSVWLYKYKCLQNTAWKETELQWGRGSEEAACSKTGPDASCFLKAKHMEPAIKMHCRTVGAVGGRGCRPLKHHSLFAFPSIDSSLFYMIHTQEQASPSRTAETFIGQGVGIVKCCTGSSTYSLCFGNSMHTVFLAVM